MKPAAAAAPLPSTAAASANNNPSTEHKAAHLNQRASRWSDAPPAVNEADFASVEPPQKKVKNDPSPSSSSVEKTNNSLASHGSEAPPGPTYTAPPLTSTPSCGVSDSTGTGYRALPQLSAHQNYQNYGSHSQTVPPPQGSFAPGSLKGTAALFYKTKLCTKFQIGACTFNERCHFAHGMEDLRKPSLMWEGMAGGGTAGTTGGGSFMGQPRPKTRPCRYFADGNCPYGDRCNFLHGNEDPQRMQATTGYYSGTVPTIVAAQPQQAYSGVSAYPNSGNMPSNVHFSYPNQGFSTPYANSSSSLPVPYAESAGYSAGAAGSAAAAPNTSLQTPYGSTTATSNASFPASYGSTPATTNVSLPLPHGSMLAVTNESNQYVSSQQGTNGAANYTAWNGSVGAPNSALGYMQTNQTASQGYQTAFSMPNYGSTNYAKVANGAAIPQYPQEQAQQQPYAQGFSENPQQGATTHGDGNYYQNAYPAASFSNTQADYTTRYMVEPWGGQVQ